MTPKRLVVASACLGVALALLCADSRVADAAPSVVVLRIDGERNARVQRELIDMLSTRFEVIPEWRYRRAARRMRARALLRRNVKRVARRLRAQVVIYGDINRRKLALNVRSGRSGELVKRYYVPLRRKRLTRRFRRLLNRKLIRLIRDVVAGRLHRKRRARRGRRRMVERRRVRRSRSRVAERRSRVRGSRRPSVRQRRARARREARERRLRKRRSAQERRERAARERRRKALAAKRRKAREAAAERKLFEEKTDDKGYVIDDEIPEVLKKK